MVDDYSLTRSDIKDPPQSLGGRLKHLGPSLILTANIVGAGELIMTTTLGATAGFVTLWVILVSCLVKVAVQLEFGKHAISTGEPALEALNRLPGPRWRGTSWSIWMWLGIKLVQFVQYGGMIGGVALALNIAFPLVDVWIWTTLAGLATALLVFKGHYRFIERFAIILVSAFSIFTLFCVFVLQTTPYQIGINDLGDGLTFHLPAAAIGIGLAAFSLTGVSADEIISFPYWCLEKGYARFTGPRDSSPEWTQRARGWIQVMYLDALISMVIYTLVTIAFFLLGAAILFGREQIPAGYDMIRTLSQIYTESVGPGAMIIFLIGAVVTLFSSLFIGCASGTRMFTDALAQCGALDFHDIKQRQLWFGVLAWFLPISWALLFLTIQAPVYMVMAGGIALAFLLILVIFAAFIFRYRRLSKDLHPGILYDVLLWISFLAIGGVGVRTWVSLF